MLTPTFSIDQDDKYLFVKIHAPYTQLKDVQINVLDSVFWFYSSPYFLRLHFSCGLVDDDEPPASFNSGKGEFEVRLQKEQPGQHFPDLDLLGRLLVPKKIPKNIKPTIEVIPDTDGDCEQEEEEEDEDEWLLEQELPQTEQASSLLQDYPKYGFGNQTSGVFLLVKSEFKEIIDLPDPDGTSAAQGEGLRFKEENAKFSVDHFLADFVDTRALGPSLKYKAPWYSETPESVKLTPEEKESLKKLGNKEFLLSKEEKAAVWFSLADIVFAYAYNHRTTEGENTVESAWTINKLSATLSWLSSFSDFKSVVKSCFRRSLTYPLFRNWALTRLVFKDTIAILKLGRRRILKCLLEIHSLFAASEPRYLLNQLYISDYCIWLQHASESKLAKFTKALEETKVYKSQLEFNDLLPLIERVAYLTLCEHEGEQAARVRKLNFQPPGERSSSEDSESCGSETGSASPELDSDDDSSPESEGTEKSEENETKEENDKNEENKEKEENEMNEEDKKPEKNEENEKNKEN